MDDLSDLIEALQEYERDLPPGELEAWLEAYKRAAEEASEHEQD